MCLSVNLFSLHEICCFMNLQIDILHQLPKIPNAFFSQILLLLHSLSSSKALIKYILDLSRYLPGLLSSLPYFMSFHATSWIISLTYHPLYELSLHLHLIHFLTHPFNFSICLLYFLDRSSTCIITAASGKNPCSPRNWASSGYRGKPSNIKPVELCGNFIIYFICFKYYIININLKMKKALINQLYIRCVMNSLKSLLWYLFLIFLLV